MELIRALVEAGTPILTVEDHARIGGFGAAVVEGCNDEGLSTDNIFRLALPDHWIYQGSRTGQQVQAGIDPDTIATTALQILESAPGRRPVQVQVAGVGGSTTRPHKFGA